MSIELYLKIATLWAASHKNVEQHVDFLVHDNGMFILSFKMPKPNYKSIQCVVSHLVGNSKK